MLFLFKFQRLHIWRNGRNLHWQSGWHVMKPSSSNWCEATRFISISIFSSPVFTWTLFIPNRMSWSNVRNSHLKCKRIDKWSARRMIAVFRWIPVVYLLENAAGIVAQEIQFQFWSLLDDGVGEFVIVIVFSIADGVHFLGHFSTPI